MARSKIRIRLAVLAIAALAIPIAGTSVAQADTGTPVDHYHCTFNGLAGIPAPTEAENAGVENAATEAIEQASPGSEGSAGTEAVDDPAGSDNAAIDMGGDDDGSFTFGGSATCAFVDSGQVDTLATDLGATGTYCASISASGTYEDVQAGTGTADGTATVNFGTNGSSPCDNTMNSEAEGPISIKFHINFTTGSGTITATASNGEGESGNGGGAVNIVPTAGAGPCVGGGPCQPGVNQDVSAFSVNGGFSGVIMESGK